MKTTTYRQSNGYIYEHRPNHPLADNRGRVLQHRRIWFDRYGEMPKDQIIHHKNGDRTDNRLSNLQLMSRGEHVFKHRLGTGKVGQFQCSSCKRTFSRSLRVQKYCIRKGHRPCCSMRCAMILFHERCRETGYSKARRKEQA